MDANPQIKTPRNIQSGRKRAAKSSSKSSSRKKVKSSDEEGDPKMNLLNRLVRNQERTSLQSQISDVRLQITEDEMLLVKLGDRTGTWRAELRGIERKLVKDGIDEEEFSTDRWWREINEEYEATKLQIANVKTLIKRKEEQLEALLSRLKSGYDVVSNAVGTKSEQLEALLSRLIRSGYDVVSCTSRRTSLRSRARRQSWLIAVAIFMLFEMDEDW